MNLFLFLSRHFIKSRKESKIVSKVSAITILGISLGVAVVILALTILDGFEKTVASKVSNFNTHIRISGFGSRDLPEPQFVMQKLNEKFGNHFISIDPFASKLSIVKLKKNVDGIIVNGITENYARTSFANFIQSGKIELGKKNIIIGKLLAEKLGAGIGSKLTLFSLSGNRIPSQDNPPSIEQFIVSAIFETGISEYDDGNAFIDLAIAQNMFGINESVSGYNIKVKNLLGVARLSENLQEYMGYPYYVRTIFQIHQNIFTWIELQKKPIPIVLGLIMIVAVFNIVGTMLMNVLDKTNSIGILRSLGTNRATIQKVFFISSGYIIFWGLLIGNSIALLFSILQKQFNIITLPGKVYFVTAVPISIDLNNYLLVNGATLIVAFLSSFIPAWIASKVKPITAIKFD